MSWSWKVKVIRQHKWHNQLPWPQKHRSRHQNLHPKCFSSKVIIKDIFLHNGGQRNAFAYVKRSNRPRCVFHLLKGLNPGYLVLKFGNILLVNSWDMAQNVISQRSSPWKVKVIGQNKWHHQIPWPSKHISRCQNHHPKCLTLKVMVKDFFLYNATNVMHLRTSHVQTTQDVFWSIERSRPKLSCVNIWQQFVQQKPRYGPKCDFI